MTMPEPAGARPPGGARRYSSRASGWPVLRTPRWMLAGGLVLVAGLTLAAIPHHPSPPSAPPTCAGWCTT